MIFHIHLLKLSLNKKYFMQAPNIRIFLATNLFSRLLLTSKIFLIFIILFISFSNKVFSTELDNLFLKLKESTNPTMSKIYEAEIWDIWLNNGSSDANNFQMKIGVKYLQNGKLEKALSIFEDISKKDPNWSETYNKIATVKFLKGDYSGSVSDIQKTLKLEPRHFGAISGLVQINIILKNYEEALKNLEYVLKIHPYIGIKKLKPYLKELLKKSSI